MPANKKSKKMSSENAIDFAVAVKSRKNPPLLFRPIHSHREKACWEKLAASGALGRSPGKQMARLSRPSWVFRSVLGPWYTPRP